MLVMLRLFWSHAKGKPADVGDVSAFVCGRAKSEERLTKVTSARVASAVVVAWRETPADAGDAGVAAAAWNVNTG